MPVVAARLGLIRGRRYGQDGPPQDMPIRIGDSEGGREDTRFMAPITVLRIQRVLLKLHPEVGALTIGQFH